jgi:hypothetical protein
MKVNDKGFQNLSFKQNGFPFFFFDGGGMKFKRLHSDHLAKEKEIEK